VLDPIEDLFDQVSIPIEVPAEADRLSPLAARLNVCPLSTRRNDLMAS